MRGHLSTAVSKAMTREVVAVSPRDALSTVESLFDRRRFSSAPVIDGGALVGVVSRTDLLRAGRRDAAGHGGALAPLTSGVAGDVATCPAISVSQRASVSEAAGLMVRHRIHRVFVVDEGELRGVFSTLDLLRVIAEARLVAPLGEVMSAPAFTLPLQATVAHAADRLAAAHVSGVVVVDEEGWPVGIFSQREALECHRAAAETPVEEVMNPALVCLHVKAPLHRAARLAASARARRVLVIDDRRVVGVVSPLDFARAVSG